MKRINVDQSINKLLDDPRIVRELKTVVENFSYKVEADIEVDGVLVRVEQDKYGAVTAEFTLHYPKEIEDKVRDNAAGFDGYASAWFEDKGFMKDVETLGYQAWEDITWENSEGYYLEWGVGMTVRLNDVKNVPDAIAKIRIDLSKVRSLFDSLCAEAMRELAKKGTLDEDAQNTLLILNFAQV